MKFVLLPSHASRAYCALLATTLVSSALAQSTPSAPPQTTRTKPDTEAVELSPFVVSSNSDVGWSGTETLMASRTKQQLKDVPFAIDAITSDFLTDLDLGVADDAARFVAGVHANFQMENDNDQASVSFRGIAQRYNLSRNYFRTQVPSDNYNVERIDFGKGSNSLVFGDTEPGGQGSVQSKRAQFRDFGRAFAQYGSEDAYRVELDINRQLAPQLAVRVNLVKREQKTYQDFSTYALKAGTITATWRPFKNTEIRIEAEKGNFTNNRGFTGLRVREQSARSLGFTNNFWYVTSDGAVIQSSALPAADRNAANNPSGGALSLLAGRSFDVRLVNAAGSLVGTRRITGLPEGANIRGSFDLFARPYNTHTFTIEQRVKNLGLEITYNFQNQNGDRNDGAFSNTISVDVNGRPYTDVNGIDRKYIGDEAHAFRLAGVLPVQPFKWMRQQLVGVLEYRELSRDQKRIRLSNFAGIDNGTQTRITGAEQVRYRVYLDDPAFYSAAFFEKFRAQNLPRTPTFRADWFSYDNSDTYFERISSASLASTGTYFDGRFQTVLGIRRDQAITYDYVGIHLDAIGQHLPAPRYKNSAIGDFVTNPGLRSEENTGSAGLSYALSRDLNIYSSWGTSFRPQNALTFDLVRLGPITGMTKEVGLKGDFFRRKLTASLGVFEIERQNVSFTWAPNELTNAELRDLFNPNELAPTDPRFRNFADAPANITRATEQSRGFDTTLLARPFPGLQVRVTVAKIQLQTFPEFGAFRALLTEAKARGNESPANLADAELILSSSDVPGKPTGARGSPWSGSWAFDYAFPRETARALRGVRAGINGFWRQNYLLGIANKTDFHGGATHIVGAYLLRDQKLWGHDVRFRLGAKSLHDFENGNYPRKTGIVTRLDGGVSYAYSYIMPAQYDVSITVKF